MSESRKRERSSSSVVAITTVVAVVMIAQQIASKAVRDGFFLSEFEVTAVPIAAAAGAAVSFCAAIVLGRMMTSFSPSVAVPIIFATSAIAFFVEAAWVEQSPRVIAAAMYLHLSAFGGAVVSGFWSVINERFDPYAARRVMGRIAGGATAGGMIGGALTWAFADLPTSTLLIGLGVANLGCGVALLSLSSPDDKSEPRKSTSILDGFKVLGANRYPRLIALLVFGGAVMTACIDYVFKVEVMDGMSKGALVGFFAVFYTGTGIATFLLQTVGSKRFLRWAGVVGAVGMLPLVAIPLLLVAVIFPGLGTLVALRGVAMVIENSLYRSGYELLYTPVPRAQKRSAKILIDLGSDRLGSAAGSGVALLVIAAYAGAPGRVLLLVALTVACLGLALIYTLWKEYVASLAAQLRSSLDVSDESSVMPAFGASIGGLAFDESSFEGATSTASGTFTTTLTREEILDEVRIKAEQKAGAAAEPRPRMERSHGEVSSRLVETPLLIALRADSAEESEEWSELLRSAPGTVGQLLDTLLSARESIDVRVCAAELLSTVPNERVSVGMLHGLRVPEFRVRRACALALLRVTEAVPRLRPEASLLVEIASAELGQPPRRLAEGRAFEQRSPFRTNASGSAIAPSLEFVFLVLAVWGDRRALQLALSAVTSRDARERGTGLEYLDNLIPLNLRTRLLALAERPELTQTRRRFPPDLLDQLERDFRGGGMSIRQLRARYRKAIQARFDDA
ncbi:MAG: hypothetical protein ACI9KE_002769 [Polyangiales bacterium]